MGTYEIFYMDSVQDHTACNLCVKLAADHGFRSVEGICERRSEEHSEK